MDKLTRKHDAEAGAVSALPFILAGFFTGSVLFSKLAQGKTRNG